MGMDYSSIPDPPTSIETVSVERVKAEAEGIHKATSINLEEIYAATADRCVARYEAAQEKLLIVEEKQRSAGAKEIDPSKWGHRKATANAERVTDIAEAIFVAVKTLKKELKKREKEEKDRERAKKELEREKRREEKRYL